MSSLATKIEKLYKGYASIRSNILKLCLDKGYDLVVQYKDDTMTIPYKNLKDNTQFTVRKFKSKFDNREYELFDFKFISDKDKIEEVQGTIL